MPFEEELPPMQQKRTFIILIELELIDFEHLTECLSKGKIIPKAQIGSKPANVLELAQQFCIYYTLIDYRMRFAVR